MQAALSLSILNGWFGWQFRYNRANDFLEVVTLIDNPKPINLSGHRITACKSCPELKRRNWIKIQKTMTGDAPKDFLGVYEYGAAGCRKSKQNTWPKYIAKVGHKYYPNESIAEHLITRLGQQIGLQIADSRLAHVRGQLRFMSRYFLTGSQYLVHGADIYSSFLDASNNEFVETIEAENCSPDFFDYEFAVDAISGVFGSDSPEIIRSFHKMLAFDALIGNNDRHFFNWGVICDQIGDHKPYFSPIYDTARALFWNQPEAQLSKKKNSPTFLRKYSSNSYSKLGATGIGRVNHFALIRSILEQNPTSVADLDILDEVGTPVDMLDQLFAGEFCKLISPTRQDWIRRLIIYRTSQFQTVLSGGSIDD